MNRERETLQGLKTQAEKFSKAITKVGETSQRLGSNQGPEYLNYQSVPGLDRVFRIRRVGEIRSKIATRTLPVLESDRAEIVIKIRSKVQEEIGVVRQLFKDRFISRGELNLARKELTDLSRLTGLRVKHRSGMEQTERRQELDLQILLLRTEELTNQQRADQLGLTMNQLARRITVLIRNNKLVPQKRRYRPGVSARVALEQVLDKHLAANPNKPVTLAELAREIGTTRERIRQLYPQIAAQRSVPPLYKRKVEGTQEDFDQRVKKLLSQDLSMTEVSQELRVTIGLVKKSSYRTHQAETRAEQEKRETQVRELRLKGFGDKRISEITGLDNAIITRIVGNLAKNDERLRLRKVRKTGDVLKKFEDLLVELRLDPRNFTNKQIAEIVGETLVTVNNHTRRLKAEGRIPRRGKFTRLARNGNTRRKD